VNTIMAKRTPSKPAHPAELQAAAPQEQTVMPASPVSAPAVIPSSGKASVKGKAKPAIVRDDESLLQASDAGPASTSEPPDSYQDVVVAQANTTNTTSSTQAPPTSVGEELLRQAGPLPGTTAAGQEAGFFATSWGLPVAVGAGAGALALSNRGGGGSSTPPTNSDHNLTPPEVVPPVPTTYNLTVVPMAGKFFDGVKVDIYKNGALWKTLNASDLDTTTGKFTLTVQRTDLQANDVLHLVLTDTNGSAKNYKDETSGNVSADLGAVVLNAWTVVPGSITGGAGALSLAVTPLTELAHRNLGTPADTATPSATDIAAANNSVAKAFGLQPTDGSVNVDLTQTVPVATNDTSYKTADVNAQAYGQALAVISSLAKSQNLASDGVAPTPDALQKAITLLQDANTASNPGDFVLSANAQSALSQAVIAYNKIAAANTAALFTLPGVTLTSDLGLDKSVSLASYDQSGLKLQIYAPATMKVGDTVHLKFQAYNADGSFSSDPSHTFTYDYTLTSDPSKASYTGEAVTLNRLVKDPSNELNLAPFTDANGHTLQGIGTSSTTDHLYHYRVSMDGVSSAGAYQDFNLNLSPISIQNSSLNTPSGYLKAGDSINVSVVLDQAVQWNAVAGDAAPTLTIQYVGTDGSQHTKTSALIAAGNGHVLTFSFPFAAGDQANGLITVLPGALTGDLRDTSGTPISTPLASLVDTTLSNSHLFADTNPPPGAQLSLDTSVESHAADITGDGHVYTFIKTLTPTLDVKFVNADGTGSPTDTLATTETKASVQLFAYRDGGNRTDTSTVIASKTIQPGGTAIFTASDYTSDWKKTALSSNGQAYKFYAQVVDAAGNTTTLLDPMSDLPLWLDTQPPAAPTLSFDAASSTNPHDPLPTDNLTNDTTPVHRVDANFRRLGLGQFNRVGHTQRRHASWYLPLRHQRDRPCR
jgi:hypothetical protein